MEGRRRLSLSFQKLLSVDGSHAAASCSGHRLPVPEVLSVPRNENALYARSRIVLHDDVALLVQPDMTLEYICIGIVAYGEE